MIWEVTCFMLELVPALIVGVSVWWYFFRRPKNTPPGPRGIPLLGHAPFIAENPGEHFTALSKKYGPIVSFDQGLSLAVVLNKYEVIKKAFHDMGDVFSERPEYWGPMFLNGQDSFIFTNGLKWREHRRFSLTTLRDFGMGKSSMESRILDEIPYFIQVLKDTNGKSYDVDTMLSLSVSNVTSLMEYGIRYEYDNPDVLKIKESLNDTFTASKFFLIAPLCEKLVNTPLWKMIPGYSIIQQSVATQEKFTQKLIDDHLKTYYPGKKDDYLDAFITEREERKKNGNHPELFDDKTMLTDMRMLHMVGSETTNITVRWCFLILTAHQDMQRKVHAELDKVIGRDRQPNMSDKLNTPYLEAFLMEIMRVFPLTPLYDPHMTSQDVQFEGFLIPKNTIVYGNLWAVHFDEKLFPDPYTFRPERFLNEEGKVIKSDRIITFGIGKRNCIGEGLARMSIFLYLASILQNFALLPPEGETTTPKGDTTLGYSPLPFNIRFVERAAN